MEANNYKTVTEVTTLEKKVEHQQQIIDAYEQFRTIAVKGYTNQVV